MLGQEADSQILVQKNASVCEVLGLPQGASPPAAGRFPAVAR